MKFVQYIAQYIDEQNLDSKHLTIVLPSERMRKYLSAALVERAGKPILAPEMITMDHWIRRHSERSIIDNTRALLQLFQIQLEQATSEEDRSFEDFLNWGTILLSDFNEIDRYLLDAKQVFRNLADIKEIENWSFGEEELSRSQKRFMEFWDRLPSYYQALNSRLNARNECYIGSAYKALAENIRLVFSEDKDRHFLFAGFNALSQAEKSIVRQLMRYGRGHYLMDADHFYFDKKSHEAGSFLRDISAYLELPKLTRKLDVLSDKSMQVQLIDSVQKTGQVKIAASALATLSQEELNDTLLLLADESLIAPMVKNLPRSIGKANISLGLPIKNTAIKTWVDLIFGFQENKARFHTQAIYFQDLQNFWSHPFVNAVSSAAEKSTQLKTEQDIIAKNRIFLNRSSIQLEGIGNELLTLMTTDWQDDWQCATDLIYKMNQLLYEGLDDTMAFERAMLQCFHTALIEMKNLVAEGLPEMQLKSFRMLFQQHWSRKSVAYHGNPTDGLQIMGMLETRGLDFKRIICLGMNEGNLPPTNPVQTLIPMDLRRYLGLPTPREKQGIFAHHFYRLLHYCDELILAYTTAEESLGSNEVSRYALQLELELQRANPNITIDKRVYSLQVEKTDLHQEIVKTPQLLSRLTELFATSTSASMLKTYLTCPMDFYYRYVMDFGETNTVEEEVEQSTFGTFIHNTLERLYMPFVQAKSANESVVDQPKLRAITTLDVEHMLKDYPVLLKDEFLRHFDGNTDAFLKGKNRLSYEMALELTKRFLKSELKFLSKQTQPVYILGLEKEYQATVEVNVHGTLKKVRLRGIIDRIDAVGDTIRIVDYKTGRVDSRDVTARMSDDTPETLVEVMGSKKHILQLVQYAYLFFQNEGKLAHPAIISMVSGKSEPFYLDVPAMDIASVVALYPDCIAQLLEEIFDPEIPFVHKSSGMFSYCKYC
jgi:hypothetical protein